MLGPKSEGERWEFTENLRGRMGENEGEDQEVLGGEEKKEIMIQLPMVLQAVMKKEEG